MQIASVSAMQSIAAATKVPEAHEGPGPDRDGDGDDKGGVKSATAPGVGGLLDVSA